VFVSCPDCQEKYSISPSRIPPQGGRLTCRICGGRIVLTGRRPGMGTPVVAKGPDVSPAASDTGKRSAKIAGSSAKGIECPHCGKSFVPGEASRTTPTSAAGPSAGAKTVAEAPFKPARPASGSAPAHPSAAGGRKTILVAEDTEFFLELVKQTLGAQYRMLGARTKAEALQLLGREPIDLIILDLSLESHEDGLEVLAGAAPRGLPCLIFTARNEVDLWGDGWARLQARGASDLLLKGMNIEEQLLSKVAALLSPEN
jgi:predicted Zn finger-like uncharacterized protein